MLFVDSSNTITEHGKCVCGFFVLKDVHPREAHTEERAGRPFAGKVSKLPVDSASLLFLGQMI